MGLLIKLFIEDIKKELNIAVWNNIENDKLAGNLPTPAACLTVPLCFVTQAKDAVSNNIRQNSTLNDVKQSKIYQSGAYCEEVQRIETNEVCVMDELVTYHETALPNVNSSCLMKGKRGPEYELPKISVTDREDSSTPVNDLEDYLDYVKNKYASIEKDRKFRRSEKKLLKKLSFSKKDHQKSCRYEEDNSEKTLKMTRAVNKGGLNPRRIKSVPDESRGIRTSCIPYRTNYSQPIRTSPDPKDDSTMDSHLNVASSCHINLCSLSDVVLQRKVGKQTECTQHNESPETKICEKDAKICGDTMPPTGSNMETKIYGATNSRHHRLQREANGIKDDKDLRSLKHKRHKSIVNNKNNHLLTKPCNITRTDEPRANSVQVDNLASAELDPIEKGRELSYMDSSFMKNGDREYFHIRELNDKFWFNESKYYAAKREKVILHTEVYKSQVELENVKERILHSEASKVNISEVKNTPPCRRKSNFHRFGIPYFKLKNAHPYDENDDQTKMAEENDILTFQLLRRRGMFAEDTNELDHSYSTKIRKLDHTYSKAVGY